MQLYFLSSNKNFTLEFSHGVVVGGKLLDTTPGTIDGMTLGPELGIVLRPTLGGRLGPTLGMTLGYRLGT